MLRHGLCATVKTSITITSLICLPTLQSVVCFFPFRSSAPPSTLSFIGMAKMRRHISNKRLMCHRTRFTHTHTHQRSEIEERMKNFCRCVNLTLTLTKDRWEMRLRPQAKFVSSVRVRECGHTFNWVEYKLFWGYLIDELFGFVVSHTNEWHDINCRCACRCRTSFCCARARSSFSGQQYNLEHS